MTPNNKQVERRAPLFVITGPGPVISRGTVLEITGSSPAVTIGGAIIVERRLSPVECNVVSPTGKVTVMPCHAQSRNPTGWRGEVDLKATGPS